MRSVEVQHAHRELVDLVAASTVDRQALSPELDHVSGELDTLKPLFMVTAFQPGDSPSTEDDDRDCQKSERDENDVTSCDASIWTLRLRNGSEAPDADDDVSSFAASKQEPFDECLVSPLPSNHWRRGWSVTLVRRCRA